MGQTKNPGLGILFIIIGVIGIILRFINGFNFNTLNFIKLLIALGITGYGLYIIVKSKTNN